MRSAGDLFSEEDAKNAPREVMRLVNHMMSGDGDVVSGMLALPGIRLVQLSRSRSDAQFVIYLRAV